MISVCGVWLFQTMHSSCPTDCDQFCVCESSVEHEQACPSTKSRSSVQRVLCCISDRKLSAGVKTDCCFWGIASNSLNLLWMTSFMMGQLVSSFPLFPVSLSAVHKTLDLKVHFRLLSLICHMPSEDIMPHETVTTCILGAPGCGWVLVVGCWCLLSCCKRQDVQECTFKIAELLVF